MKTAVVICPGRGTYTKTELGYLSRHHADKAALLAGLGSRGFSSVTEALASLRYPTQTLQPAPDQARLYERLYSQVYTQMYPSLRAIHHAL